MISATPHQGAESGARWVLERVSMANSVHKTREIFDRYNIVNERDPMDAVGKLDQYFSLKNGHRTRKVSARKGKENELVAVPGIEPGFPD
jgi:hypothetical protein